MNQTKNDILKNSDIKNRYDTIILYTSTKSYSYIFLLPVRPQNVAFLLKLIAIDWRIKYCNINEIHYRIYTVTLSALCCCFVWLYDEKDSQVQGGCYGKWIDGI